MLKESRSNICESIINDMFTIAKMFGPEAVMFLSNYDKARISLSLAAVTLEAPIPKITLPDHSFAVARAYKLIPSVYDVCEITSKREVSY